MRQLFSFWRLTYALKKQQERLNNRNIKSLLNPSWEKKIQAYSVIETDCDLKGDPAYLGRGLYIGNSTLIYNTSSIGDFCSISSGVKIGLAAHPKHMLSTSPLFYSSGRGLINDSDILTGVEKMVEIGHDVLISANVLILEGVKIGTGAIIGAGAVVVKNVEPYTIVAGVPAKVIGKRFSDDVIQHLLNSKWWELDIQNILQLPFLKDASKIEFNR
ncbi:CatB-related O-acetyltransferase [Flavihumibacter cheonanensis]|uniref:CatB-related O-acetyltransferase n=1 Tax=Flavihumibacter cheonanensis TaxID=1442385 RepID=UPI001EF8DBF0|nr:CatB-related O-acetyltransferase [Flavihumibacter cheonanensis]